MLCMGSKLLTIKGRNTEMTAKSLCPLLSKYFMTKQKIIEAVVGEKETCLITRGKDGMESLSEKSHASRHLELWMEASTRLSGIKQKPGTFGFFHGADGIKRHRVRVGRFWTLTQPGSVWLLMLKLSRSVNQNITHVFHIQWKFLIFQYVSQRAMTAPHLLCFPVMGHFHFPTPYMKYRIKKS